MPGCWDCGKQCPILYSTSDGKTKRERKETLSVALCPECLEAATGEKIEAQPSGRPERRV